MSVTPAANGSRGIELSELLRVYPAAAMHSGTDVAMPQDAARQSETVSPAAALRHAQDKIAALEDRIADMKAQLEAAQQRELWLQCQIDQIQQRLLPPPPRMGVIERLAEAIVRLQTEAAIQARSNTVILQYKLFYKNELYAILGFYNG